MAQRKMQRMQQEDCKSKRNQRPSKARTHGKKVEVSDDQDMKGKVVNDIAWWFKNKQLFEECAQLSFQSIVGAPNPVLPLNFRPVNMMTVALNPCPGVTSTTTNPTGLNATALNLMGLKLYQQLSMQSGRTATYAPQDVTTTILAIGEILSIEEHIRRIFGLACIYNERNWTMPENVIYRLGVNATDLFQNLAAYRMRFNTDITNINRLPIIADLPYFRKCVELYSAIYVDGTSPMSSLWAYVPNTTWTIDETSYSGGTILATTPVYTNAKDGNSLVTSKTMAQLLSILESMIDALFNSSSLQIVYSDLLNLASKNEIALMKVDYCFETYQVGPTFSDEANLQCRHAVSVSAPNLASYVSGNTPYNDVYPDPNKNTVIYNPGWSYTTMNNGARNKSHNLIMNFYDDGNPSLSAKIEASRFMASFSGDSATIDSVEYAHNAILPDHYVTSFNFFKASVILPSIVVSHTNVPGAPGTSDANISDWLCGIEQVQNHPILYMYDKTTNASNIFDAFVDLDFYTTVDINYLIRINLITQQSLYDFTK